MSDERKDLIRRLFVALTVLAEQACADAVEGQGEAIEETAAGALASRLFDHATNIGLLSETVKALAATGDRVAT